MFRSRPIREAMIFVGLSYLIAVLIALALPHAELAVMLSALIPVLSVGIMTFAVFRRGERKAMWAGIGLQRAGWRWWPAAIAGPVIVVALAYGMAVCLGVAELTIPAGLPAWISGQRRLLRHQPAGRRDRDHGRGDRLARLPAAAAPDRAAPPFGRRGDRLHPRSLPPAVDPADHGLRQHRQSLDRGADGRGRDHRRRRSLRLAS